MSDSFQEKKLVTSPKEIVAIFIERKKLTPIGLILHYLWIMRLRAKYTHSIGPTNYYSIGLKYKWWNPIAWIIAVIYVFIVSPLSGALLGIKNAFKNISNGKFELFSHFSHTPKENLNKPKSKNNNG